LSLEVLFHSLYEAETFGHDRPKSFSTIHLVGMKINLDWIICAVMKSEPHRTPHRNERRFFVKDKSQEYRSHPRILKY
jgi:hypothetical protein